ncbi:hypothetical protein [Falsirhodobacter sp. 20TX0035]|uniref:hypothetical protein n=1 Tax=Falsirhodobacter sp. 20TX0035 TaxID=3022019 RepID=UPI00232D969C|nr:hypothetical protein [Falsirhodobacter sp. 20TX0035]MDB6453731.1 hypothetical protein [Falsirhodobacter sp. 20TX0035]
MLSSLSRRLDLAQRRLRFALTASPLNPRRLPTLKPERFAGRRVILIGPADTVTDDLAGVDVDAYDVIVRLNSGLFLADRDPARLGSRTDVLFHNLNEEGPRSAGAIPPPVLKRHGVHTVVFPHWSFKGSKARVHRKRKELEGSGIALNVPSVRFCTQLRRDLADHQPTVGTSAMAWLLGCDLAELAIHGFTFFSTPYAPSYNDQVRTGAEAMAWAAASEVHDPALEKPLIARRVREAEGRGMTVCLGRNVRPHLI